ncbi:MAG: prolyl oligopeptidase family serine peptidase [Bacteroidota bacterium]
MKNMIHLSLYAMMMISQIIWGASCTTSLENDPCADRIHYKGLLGEEDIEVDSLLRQVDSAEVEDISQYWESFNLKSDSIWEEIRFMHRTNRELRVVAHLADGDIHYGAIFLPKGYNENATYPVLLFAPGLNQVNPVVSINKHSTIWSLSRKFSSYIIVVPSYRGQSLIVDDRSYCSDGFFGDAFDGATDDALRLLEVAMETVNGADSTQVAVYGISRGGTVSLLAAARDKRIKAAISQVGPVDFLRKDVFDRYNLQYRYQFLNGEATFEERRKHILRSSPVHFIHDYENKLLILHGMNDKTVPLWNADEILQQREADSLTFHEYWNAGHNFDATDQVKEWLKESM